MRSLVQLCAHFIDPLLGNAQYGIAYFLSTQNYPYFSKNLILQTDPLNSNNPTTIIFKSFKDNKNIFIFDFNDEPRCTESVHVAHCSILVMKVRASPGLTFYVRFPVFLFYCLWYHIQVIEIQNVQFPTA